MLGFTAGAAAAASGDKAERKKTFDNSRFGRGTANK